MAENLASQGIDRQRGLQEALAVHLEGDAEVAVDVLLHVQVEALDGDILRGEVDPPLLLQRPDALADDGPGAIDLDPEFEDCAGAGHGDEGRLRQLVRRPMRAVRADETAGGVATALVERLETRRQTARAVLPAVLSHADMAQQDLLVVWSLEHGHQGPIDPGHDLPMVGDVRQPHLPLPTSTGTRQRREAAFDGPPHEVRALEADLCPAVVEHHHEIGDP
mmetsp:Transcript_178206/g.571233  ORF Transcript_178206/g.571233 Transcript_178206/m.571233 type:complete len:221 (+) Transcript_178206:1540-2202(+)